MIAELLLTNLLGYLINLAAGERSAAFAATRERKIKETIEKDENLKKALASTHSIRDEIRIACAELARNRAALEVPAQEEPLWKLLTDEVFQADLTEWLMAGGIAEGNAVKGRILQAMENALLNGGASVEHVAQFKASYFEAVEKAVYAHPVLAQWRHQLSLDYLREQVAILRRRADEAVGIYSQEKQDAALERYCTKALEAWDIIDLSNLPEGDVHMASQKLLLRQLYMPLRIVVEPIKQGEGDNVPLERLEELREARRHLEAGHVFVDDDLVARSRSSRTPIGQSLGVSRRLVVLGDPGGGKTTMLRWLATAYLLKHRSDAAFSQVPDTDTLPDQPWVPVLIRCRDLGEDDLCRCFTDFLTQHLNKSELLPGEADVMRAVVLDRVARGQALILVDGLDEITNPQVRMMFCQELERTAARYPSPIVVTSRIVGYRDMPYRMGSGFLHGVIAELTRSDKDMFAQRWVAVTEQEMAPSEREKRVKGLLEALHSSDRIERLTGNPMLLTTLALVERKSGKLPNRRSELYFEAVHVLLNFNPRHRSLDKAEAIPQLAYLAFQMCYLGVQRLTEDEILTLLEKFRHDYPHVRAVKAHDPQVFLTLLEAQSSILIRAGSIWKNSVEPEQRVWEFRHLTFQEYLASRALIDGRYPDRDKTKSLAEQVAPLAGKVEESKRRRRGQVVEESEVPESWREALRLLIAECKDDDVDEVILAILTPSPGEDGAQTSRPRAVLAALCVADEPNISEETALKVLDGFVANMRNADGGGRFSTTLSLAGAELGKSMWAEQLKKRLMFEYLERPPDERTVYGGLWAMIEAQNAPESIEAFIPWLSSVRIRIDDTQEIEQASAAMVVMMVAFLNKAALVPDLIESLFRLLTGSPAVRYASVWALGWLSKGIPRKWSGSEPVWRPKSEEVTALLDLLQVTEPAESDTVRWLLAILGSSGDMRAVQPSVQSLEDADVGVRRAAADVLGKLGDKQAVQPLLAKLADPDSEVREAVVAALARLGDTKAVPVLLPMLEEQHKGVLLSVIRALKQFGDRQAVEPLLRKLEDQNSDVRQAVVAALVQLGDKLVVEPLIKRLEDQDSNVRHAVVGALVQLGGGEQVVAPLVQRLEDQDSDVRIAVISGLAQLRDTRAVPPLMSKLDDQDPSIRQAVVRALGRLGDKRTIPALLTKLEDRSSRVQQAVIRALGQLGDKQAVQPLLAKLEDKAPEIAANAALALQHLGVQNGEESLRMYLSSDDARFRLAAVNAYAQGMDATDQTLLSRDLDGLDPAIDPREIVTEQRVLDASNELSISTEDVRSRYETLASALALKLSWST